jgi:hypothetical protein
VAREMATTEVTMARREKDDLVRNTKRIVGWDGGDCRIAELQDCRKYREDVLSKRR